MLTKINGRSRFFNSITRITRVKPGRWAVERNGDIYTVVGGRAAGGAHNEWYVESRHYSTPLWATSLVESLNLIDNT